MECIRPEFESHPKSYRGTTSAHTLCDWHAVATAQETAKRAKTQAKHVYVFILQLGRQASISQGLGTVYTTMALSPLLVLIISMMALVMVRTRVPSQIGWQASDSQILG